MPALGSGAGKSAAAERKIAKKKVVRKAPSKPPSKPVVARAKAQQQAYVSQGKAVEKTANSQRKERQSRAQEREHVDQGRAVEKAATDQRRAARIKYLRRTRPTGMRLINHLADKAIEGAVIPSTGGGPNLGGRGNVPFTKAKSNGRVATALAPKPVTVGKGKIGKLAGNLTHDAITFPAQAISSTYDVAAGVAEAAHGKPARIKRIAHDFKQSDPVYNTVAAGVEAAKGNSRAAKSHIRKAGKAVEEHPGLAALEVAGVKGTVGRTAGRTMRSGVAGKAAKRAASTERAPRRVPNTNIEEQRTYSKDVLKKAGQVVVERTQRKRSQRAARQAAEAERQGHTERAAALRQKAADRDPDRLPEEEIKRQVDERVAVNEDVRRYHRAKVTANVHKTIKVAKREGHAVSVVAQRIVKADKADIRAYITELEGEFPKLSPSQKRANKTLRRELQKVVDDPKADMATVERVAQEYEKLTTPVQGKLVKRGLLNAEQADRAKLTPYAVRRMGAKREGGRMVRPVTRIRSAVRVEGGGGKLPSREEFIANRPKADPRDTPDFAAMTHTLPERGEPGIHVERDFKRYHDRDGGGLSDQHVPGTDRKVVARGPDGRVQGVLHVFFDEHGKADLLQVVVAPESRGKGLASRLYRYADQQGWDVEAASGRGGLTEAGAALQHKRLVEKNKPRRVVERTVTTENVPLRPKAVRAHMKAHGESEPAFMTQAPNQRGARNFNIRSEKAQTLVIRRRTGAATKQGTLDAHPDTLIEGAARAQGLADAVDGFRRTIKEFGHRRNGKLQTFKSYDKALQAAKDAVHDDNGDPIAGAHQLRPVKLNPNGASKEQLDNLLNEVDSLDQGHAPTIDGMIRDALEGKGGSGKWALIPEAAAQRLLEHLDAQGGGGGIKTLQLANQAFRKTVLSTSPTWFAGNIIEGIGRAALSRAGARSYVHGRRVLKELEAISPKAAEEAMSRTISGGHYASADKTHIRRGAEQFAGTKLAPLATALGKFWRTPGPKQAAGLWNAYTQWVFHAVNGAIESKIQTAMLGRALLDAGQKAVDDAAKGLTNTPAQIRFGREVDRMYGRYGKRSPAERKFFATYTPFAPWAINAAYFVYRTLPRDHPTVTAVIAAAEQATEEWRQEHGLDQFMGKGALPPFLQGSIPTKGGGHLRAARFTPFGAFGSPSETIAGQVLPLWTGVTAALKGQDWKGQKLTVDENGKKRDATETERFVFAARALAEATIPVYSTAKRVSEQGPEALNPFKVVKSKPKKPKKIRVYKSGASKEMRKSSSSSAGGGFFNEGSSSSGSSGGGGFFNP